MHDGTRSFVEWDGEFEALYAPKRKRRLSKKLPDRPAKALRSIPLRPKSSHHPNKPHQYFLQSDRCAASIVRDFI